MLTSAFFLRILIKERIQIIRDTHKDAVAPMSPNVTDDGNFLRVSLDIFLLCFQFLKVGSDECKRTFYGKRIFNIVNDYLRFIPNYFKLRL